MLSSFDKTAAAAASVLIFVATARPELLPFFVFVFFLGF